MRAKWETELDTQPFTISGKDWIVNEFRDKVWSVTAERSGPEL